MATISEVFSEKGKTLLVIDNFKFRYQKPLSGNVKRWACVKRDCKAFLKTDQNNEVLSSMQTHNHGSESLQIFNRKKLSNDLKRKAMDDISEKPSHLINTELQINHVDTLTVGDTSLIRKNVYNARKAILPNIPSSIGDVHDALNAIIVETNKGENFLLVNDDASNIIIFSCHTNLRILCEMESIYVDGTFRYCTKHFLQLFTIHGLKNGYYIPLVFCLLPNKTESTYLKAFEALKKECDKINLQLLPKFCYADFEKAIHSSALSAWPNVIIKGCRFHLGQAW